MKIGAVGAVTPMGNSEAEIWERLCEGREGNVEKAVSFTSVLPPKVRRRSNRFADLAAAAAVTCYEALTEKPENKNRIGCIFNTAYGPLKTNLEFAKQLVEDEPDACSPTLFSNTVHNACLGTISIQLGITGPSTMLLGSNQLWLSGQMLEEKKADVMLAGAVEEYREELKESLDSLEENEERYADGAVVFALLPEGEEESGVKIRETITVNLGITPFEKKRAGEETLIRLFRRVRERFKPDAVICHSPAGKFGEAEKEALAKIFPEACIADRFQEYFGNTLGADMGMKVLVGKMILERGTVPKNLCSALKEKREWKTVLVLSSDITGNYYITVLEK